MSKRLFTERSYCASYSRVIFAASFGACTMLGCASNDSPNGGTGGRSASQGGALGSGHGGTNASGASAMSGGASALGGNQGTSSATGGSSGNGQSAGGNANGGTTLGSGGNGAVSSGGRSTAGGSGGGSSAQGGGSNVSTGGNQGGGAAGAGGTTSTGMGGVGGNYVGTKTPGTAQTGDVTVDPAKTHQVVDGFGEADVWQNSSSAAMQTLLWDPVNGIGLTLLRIGIESKSGTSLIMGDAALQDGPACKKFAGDDCKVWAAPWSPPASMKNNDNVNGPGGNNSCSGTNDTLKDGSYEAWASLLAAFPALYKQKSGVDLYAVSAQNEPDFNPNYEACCYDKNQMVKLINALGPKLAALDPPVKVLAAEPDTWGNLWGGDQYGPAILADAKASSYVGPIATHDYGSSGVTRPSPPSNNTHHVWETECTPSDTGPITIATMIYAAFTSGGANAWHYWWTQQLVPDVKSPPPQVYALGNFSKFVRPGYYRVDVSGAPTPSTSNPLVVAFSNLRDGTVAIVVVNGGSARTLSFFVAGAAWPASVTPYVTTTSSKLAAGTAINVTAGRFSASLAAQSVTTFVGSP
ncbi:MAG TPA: hypothetical protein VFQ61_13510 [Polyangiaceae bacterium]|nr:hypothetical protein [Polyangiaceae bacterium]